MSQSCNVCGTQNIKFYPVIPDAVMIKCPVCGNYLFTASSGGNNKSIPQNKNKLASYLFYNAIHDEHDLEGVVGGTNFIGTQEEYDHFKTVYVRISHITDDVITNWYPKTFNEKINRILLMLAQRTSVMGAAIELTNEEKMACFFIDRYRADNRSLLDHKAIYSQVDFLKDYMTKNELLSNVAFSSDGRMTCRLDPKGWQRVRIGNPNSYPIPKAFVDEYEANPDKYNSAWECYWYYIDKWARADGQSTVYNYALAGSGDEYSWSSAKDGSNGYYIVGVDADVVAKYPIINGGNLWADNPLVKENAQHAVLYERAMWNGIYKFYEGCRDLSAERNTIDFTKVPREW